MWEFIITVLLVSLLLILSVVGIYVGADLDAHSYWDRMADEAEKAEEDKKPADRTKK